MQAIYPRITDETNIGLRSLHDLNVVANTSIGGSSSRALNSQYGSLIPILLFFLIFGTLNFIISICVRLVKYSLRALGVRFFFQADKDAIRIGVVRSKKATRRPVVPYIATMIDSIEIRRDGAGYIPNVRIIKKRFPSLLRRLEFEREDEWELSTYHQVFEREVEQDSPEDEKVPALAIQKVYEPETEFNPGLHDDKVDT